LGLISGFAVSPADLERRSPRRARALKLQLGLILFQRVQGRTAQSLDELVPGVFAELPLDPATTPPQAYHYRLAGERDRSEAQPGQGVLWWGSQAEPSPSSLRPTGRPPIEAVFHVPLLR